MKMNAGEWAIVRAWEADHPGRDWRRHEDQVGALMAAAIVVRRARPRRPRLACEARARRVPPIRRGLAVAETTTYAALQDRLRQDRMRAGADNNGIRMP